MRRLVPFLLASLALVLAAGALAACGSSGDDAREVLQQTFSGKHSVKSGRLDLTVGFQATGGQSQGPVTIKLTGPFQSQGRGQVPKFDVVALIGAGGQQRSLGAVSTGSQGFVKVQDSAYAVPPSVYAQFRQGFQQARARSSQSKDRTTLGGLGIDPLNWLKDPKLEDDEQIGGTATKHVSADVDVSKFVDDLGRLLQRTRLQGGTQGQQLPQGFNQQQRRQLVDSIKNARFDLWSGKADKTLRKLAVSLDLKAPSGQSSQGATGGSLNFSVTLSDLNKAQTITAPTNAKSFSELQKQLQGLNLGALGGSGRGSGSSSGSGGAGGTGGTGGGSDKAKAYLDCIAKSNGDVGKAQKCADLLKP